MMECRKLDTETQVYFYEQDFYVLSNFSSFRLEWKGCTFDTSEAAYHWEKFPNEQEVRNMILNAPSAHEAFKIAESKKMFRRKDWDAVKIEIMRDILLAKTKQHEYVRRKLLATGNRELVEDSWRDDFWGWGQNHDGQNMLGKLWMEVRAELNSPNELADGRPLRSTKCVLQTKKFNRENRYTVLKQSDVTEALAADETETLIYLEEKIAAYRKTCGKAPLQCMVVERDWPEYEPTWIAIQNRIEKERVPVKEIFKPLPKNEADAIRPFIPPYGD